MHAFACVYGVVVSACVRAHIVVVALLVAAAIVGHVVNCNQLTACLCYTLQVTFNSRVHTVYVKQRPFMKEFMQVRAKQCMGRLGWAGSCQLWWILCYLGCAVLPWMCCLCFGYAVLPWMCCSGILHFIAVFLFVSFYWLCACAGPPLKSYVSSLSSLPTLQRVAAIYEVVVFTASQKVTDWLPSCRSACPPACLPTCK